VLPALRLRAQIRAERAPAQRCVQPATNSTTLHFLGSASRPRQAVDRRRANLLSIKTHLGFARPAMLPAIPARGICRESVRIQINCRIIIVNAVARAARRKPTGHVTVRRTISAIQIVLMGRCMSQI
jgi:hypothetical protein